MAQNKYTQVLASTNLIQISSVQAVCKASTCFSFELYSLVRHEKILETFPHINNSSYNNLQVPNWTTNKLYLLDGSSPHKKNRQLQMLYLCTYFTGFINNLRFENNYKCSNILYLWLTYELTSDLNIITNTIKLHIYNLHLWLSTLTVLQFNVT